MLFSLILRKIYAYLGTKVRFESKSSELIFIMLVVCVIYSLNYSYMYLYGPFYEFTEQASSQNERFIPYGEQDRSDLSGILFQGIYVTYSAGWYSDIGRLIIQSYILIVIIPPIEFAALFALRYALRVID